MTNHDPQLIALLRELLRALLAERARPGGERHGAAPGHPRGAD